MYRRLAITVCLASAVFLPSLAGQMRSMPRPGFHTPINGQRPLFVGPVGFPHHPRVHIFIGNSCFNNPFFCRQLFFRNRFPFAQPVFVPYPVYTAPYYRAPYSQAVEPPATVVYRDSDLAREVDRLRDEVERLREEQASRQPSRQASPTPRPAVEEKGPTTILVFRDGHRSEIQNYAIVRQTLWVFTGQRAQKIPLSDLDVDATKQVNADRGVEFRLP